MRKSIRERLLAGIKKVPSGCWEWQGSLSKSGYAHIGINDRTYRAHRISYTEWVGEIPAGMLVCHTCDNRKCINPEHLWLGTNSDNMRDCVSKGRFVVRPKLKRTHCIHGHKFTKKNTYLAPSGGRHCQVCQRDKYKRKRTSSKPYTPHAVR